MLRKDSEKKILITGGAGFIGSHVVRHFLKKYPEYEIFNLDALTYAGNLENLKDMESKPNYHFIKGDICDFEFIQNLFHTNRFDSVIHLAAESHVDRSIKNPLSFAQTNIIGTLNLLEISKNIWNLNSSKHLFYHVSTDEVYGSLGETGLFKETSNYSPNSPYSASKASSDHFVRAYGETFGLPYVISNCSNNYGPFQFPEKLIPLMINNIVQGKELPVYGDGKYTRDWLYVEDHAQAIDQIYHFGKNGETYNVGGLNEWKNIDIVHLLCDKIDAKLSRKEGSSRQLIKFIKDRPGHDRRYAIDASKIQKNLGWKPSYHFEEAINLTIDWYLNNENWLEHIMSGAYENYYSEQYLQQ